MRCPDRCDATIWGISHEAKILQKIREIATYLSWILENLQNFIFKIEPTNGVFVMPILHKATRKNGGLSQKMRSVLYLSLTKWTSRGIEKNR